MSPDECGEKLALLLDQQAAVCAHILEKSKMQQSLVEERREDDLLALLGEKQKLIEQHQALSEQAAPFREQWETGGRDCAGAAAHARVEASWSALREVLDAIVRLEDASRAYLEEQKSKLSVDIGNLQRGKIVNKAYGGGGFRPPPAARFSDREG